MAFLSTTRSNTSFGRRYRTTFFDLLSLHRQRRALARLDDAALDDIGVTRAQAEREAQSGFWNVPDHWLR